MKKKILVMLTLTLIFINATGAHENIDGIKAFARAYGYVKYFHPSTESTLVNWNKFAAYGVNEMLKCHNNEETLKTLNQLFKPLGPSIRFTRELDKLDISSITPNNKIKYKPTYWQHSGVSTGMQNGSYQSYQSVLVNQFKQVNDSTRVIAEPIFEEYPEIGELIEKRIGDKIYCHIPLSLYVHEGNTFPESKELHKLQAKIDSIDTSLSNLSVRLGNVIIIYNVIQHFYPYFEEVDVNWNEQLEIALERSFGDTTNDDHVITLQKLTATIKDGHLWLWEGVSPYRFYPDIHWEWIQDSLVITKVLNDTLDIQVGDVVSEVNNQSAKSYFKEVNSRISYGTETYLNHSNKSRSLSADKNTELILEIDQKEIALKHYLNSAEYQFIKPKIQDYMYKRIGDDIMYISLGTINPDTIAMLLPQLSEMKGLICDFRGHNYQVWDFYMHFLKHEIPDASITMIPKIIYPDREHPIGYDEFQFPSEPKEPYLGGVETVFIVDGRTKSSAESFINTIKRFNLATIVGEQTAGANGMINPFNILGEITIYWTGSKVINSDGSQFHCVGIIPDVYVQKSIKGIREGKDEILNKAIEIVNNK